MKQEIVFAINAEDLPYVMQLASTRPVQVFCVLPHVHEVFLRHGLTDTMLVNLSNPSWQVLSIEEQDTCLSLSAYVNLVNIPSIIKEARKAHSAFNQGLDTLLHDFLDGATIGGWLPVQLAHFLHNVLGYRRIWAEVVPRYPSAVWHVLIPNQPYCLGNHSCLAGLLLANQLSQSGIAYTAYQTDIAGLGDGQFPDLRNISSELDLLCHIPTCFYDKDYIYDEVARSGLSFGILTSEVFDVAPDQLPTSGLCNLSAMLSQLDATEITRVQALEQPIIQFLDQQLSNLITLAHYRDLQATFWWERIRNQCFFFLWLNKFFDKKKPGQLLISNHDALLHGALLSFSKKNNIPVTVVPHSKVFNFPFIYGNLSNPPLCLHHGLQDGPCMDNQGRIMPSGRLSFGGSWVQDLGHPTEIKTIGIILNGTYMTVIDEFIKGLLHLQKWCKENSVKLRLRSRTEIPLVLVSNKLNIPMNELVDESQGTVLDFAPGCDLLVSYDLHSSAVIELLRAGYAVLHADLQSELHRFWCTVDAMVVPRFQIPELLERLSLMKADPAWFREFRRRQFRAALDTQTGTQPLSVWLKNRHSA